MLREPFAANLVKLFGPVGTITSKSVALILPRSSRPLIRGSGATEIRQSPPLSALIMPYFFRPLQMAWACGDRLEMSTLALSRKRSPIRGRFWSVLLLALCVAGYTYAARV